jgi:hypothetical protein
MSWPRQGCALLGSLIISLTVAHGQNGFTGQNPIQSVSGQFVVSSQTEDAPNFFRSNFSTATNVIRLEPAFLAVSAERYKASVWRLLGLKPDSSWRGKIFLSLHPARSADESVTITSTPFLNTWTYRVDLPDALTRTRYARALAAVLLLEIANREAASTGHSAEIPAWLTDGIACQTLATDGDNIILTTPPKSLDGKPQGHFVQTEHGMDAMSEARKALADFPALTFDQLSWPTEAQMTGADGGVYFASAQLFVLDLLQLKNGAEKMRTLLAQLPACQNWQTAFFKGFRQDFQRPLDVEKWWSLRVVAFAAHASGPRWTETVSRERMAELLSVPVEFRHDSNSLPSHAEISLQAALRSLALEQRTAVMETKLRDLEIAVFQIAPEYAALADGYRAVLAEFLGERKPPASSITNKHNVEQPQRASLADTQKKLDALDLRRREMEAQMSSFQKKLRPGEP